MPSSFYDSSHKSQQNDTSSTATATATSTTSAPATKCLDIQLDDNVDHRYQPKPTTTNNETDHQCLLYVPPSIYIQTVMNFVVGAPNQGRCQFGSPGGCSKHQKYIEKDRLYGNDWPPFGYTMIGKTRLENFRAAIHEVDRNNIPGAIVEMGVWRGGAMILAAAVTQETTNSNRQLYLYDAFETIPGYKETSDFLQNSQAQVESYFELFGLKGPNVHFVKGLFQDTLPQWVPQTTPIAVLRIDGNFYDSYQDAMYAMYQDVPIGGIVIFDDIMSYPAVMQFWNDFKVDQNIQEELNRIDKHSAWFRKRSNGNIDQSKKRPPQDVNKQ